MTRLGKYALGAVVAVLLILFVRLLDYWVVTDQEKIVNTIQVMADGVAARDMDRVFAHVSPRFRLDKLDKAHFRDWAEPHIRNGDVSSIRVWVLPRGSWSVTAARRRSSSSLRPRRLGARRRVFSV